jgi:hypothetical protein
MRGLPSARSASKRFKKERNVVRISPSIRSPKRGRLHEFDKLFKAAEPTMHKSTRKITLV